MSTVATVILIIWLIILMWWSISWSLFGNQPRDSAYIKELIRNTKDGYLIWKEMEGPFKEYIGLDCHKPSEVNLYSLFHCNGYLVLRGYSEDSKVMSKADPWEVKHYPSVKKEIAVKPRVPLKKLLRVAKHYQLQDSAVNSSAPPLEEDNDGLFGLGWGEEPEWAIKLNQAIRETKKC